MARILRKDYIIRSTDTDYLVIENIYNKNVSLPILQVQAVYLSLFDGLREDEEINQIVGELFDNNSFKLKSVNRFLMPVELAYSIFGVYEHKYEPIQFLSRKYKNENSVFLHSPRYLTLCLTHKCRRKCIYCYANPAYSNKIEKDAMPNYMIDKILADAFDMAIEGVLLTGGEPMMHPYIYNIIDFLSNHGIYTQVITKHPLKKEHLMNINTTSLDLCLSIDTNDSGLAKCLTGSRSYFDDIQNNISMLKGVNIPFNVAMTITRKNEINALSIVNDLLEKGAKHIFTNHYFCDNDINAVEELMMSADEKRVFDAKWTACIKENGLNECVSHKSHPDDYFNNLDHVNCSGLTKKVTIDYNGNYVLCDRLTDIDFGFNNIYHQSILEHWNSDIMNYYRNPPKDKYNKTICFHCISFNTCNAKNSCYVKSLAQYNMMYRPIKEVEYVCGKR